MARKQAKRRKQTKKRQFRMPSLPVRGIAVLLFATAIVALSYQFSARLLDREISSISLEGRHSSRVERRGLDGASRWCSRSRAPTSRSPT